ncbi:MAG: OmpH family outer membrane protein [Chitinophagales bacterium]|nr:OmpH family outer membrane protein [Chitinophagales bacterium]
MRKSVLIVAATLFMLSGTVNAQQKIGHLNSMDVLTVMPEFKQMQDDIQKQKDAYTKVLEGMYQDYDKKQKDLQAKSQDKSTPDVILETMIQELQQLQQRISDFEDKVNGDLQKSQQDKMKPINDKYLKAVKEVAEANGYAYIIDVASGAVAYFPDKTNDVTELVTKKLGVTAGTTAPKTGN